MIELHRITRRERQMKKSVELVATLLRSPDEFLTRVASSVEVRLEGLLRPRTNYSTEEWPEALSKIGKLLRVDFGSVVSDAGLKDVESAVQSRLQAIPIDAPFPLFHNGDFRLARLCYALVRALSPESVVETGVCYGVSSAFILKALEQNGTGALYSIDMPPLGSNADRFVGWLIPPDLRKRWRLFLGPSKDLLPRVLAQAGVVGMFLHDSKHTYWNIRRELRTVTAALAQRSAVIADDVEGNSAFLEWALQCNPPYWAAVAEESKDHLLGIAAFAQNA